MLTAQQSPNCLHFVFIVFVMPGTSLQSLSRGGCQDQADYCPGYTGLPRDGMGPIHTRNGFTKQKYLNLKNPLQKHCSLSLYCSIHYRDRPEKSAECKYLVLGSLADYPRFTRLRSSHLKVIKRFLKTCICFKSQIKETKES